MLLLLFDLTGENGLRSCLLLLLMDAFSIFLLANKPSSYTD